MFSLLYLHPTNGHSGEVDFMHDVSTSLQEDLARDFPADEAMPEWCIAADPALQYIPKDIYQKMTPQFYRGFALALENIMQILVLKAPKAVQDAEEAGGKTSGHPATSFNIPTVAAVSERLQLLQDQASALDEKLGSDKPSAFCDDSKAIRFFLDAGGKVEHALEALIDQTQEKSPIGSLYKRKAFVRDEEDDFQDDVRELPECAHDLEFDLVREKVGLKEKEGPYWYFLSDDEDADDDENVAEDEVTHEGTQQVTSNSKLACNVLCTAPPDDACISATE